MGSGWVFWSFDRARWDAIFGSRAAGAGQKILDAMLWEQDGYFDSDSDELRPGNDRDKVLSSAKGQAAQKLASHLVNKGFTYRGLVRTQSVLLDEFGCQMWSPVWSPEGLGEVLDAKQLSDSWLPPNAVRELLFRAGHFRSVRYLEGPVTGSTVRAVIASWWANSRKMKRPASLPATPVRLLRLLKTGRRFGTEAEPTRGDSCLYVVFSPAELVELRQEIEAAINTPIPWTEPDWQPEEIEKNLHYPLNETIKAGRWGTMKYAW